MASNLSLKFHEIQEQKRSHKAQEALTAKEQDLKDRLNLRDNLTKNTINKRDNETKRKTNLLDNQTKSATAAGLSTTQFSNLLGNQDRKQTNAAYALDALPFAMKLFEQFGKGVGNFAKFI